MAANRGGRVDFTETWRWHVRNIRQLPHVGRVGRGGGTGGRCEGFLQWFFCSCGRGVCFDFLRTRLVNSRPMKHTARSESHHFQTQVTGHTDICIYRERYIAKIMYPNIRKRKTSTNISIPNLFRLHKINRIYLWPLQLSICIVVSTNTN